MKRQPFYPQIGSCHGLNKECPPTASSISTLGHCWGRFRWKSLPARSIIIRSGSRPKKSKPTSGCLPTSVMTALSFQFQPVACCPASPPRGSYPAGTSKPKSSVSLVGCLGHGFVTGKEEELRQEQAKTSIRPHQLFNIKLFQALVTLINQEKV